MITRRVHGRELRLRPSKRVNQIVQYVAAVVASRTGVRLHCIVAMSNHWHLGVSDPHGRICEFTRDCHSLIARHLNQAHGDFESLWSSEQTSMVECVEAMDLVDKIAYSMANPVEAGLVAHGKNWPGVRVCWPARPRTVQRPEGFFRDEKRGGRWPARATLEMARLPGFDGLSDAQLAALIAGKIEELEAMCRQQRRAAGKRFMGRRQALAQSRYGRPTTRAPRFKLAPRVACKDPQLRKKRLWELRMWREAYRAALARWRDGDRGVLFPFGTYRMRVLHGAACAPPG